MTLSVREAAFVAAFEEQSAALRAEARDLVAKSAELVCWDISVAWQAIESEASRLVEKSSEPLTKEKAVSRVLRTPKGKQLYSNYIAAQDSVRQTLEVAEGNAARRDHDQWVREQTVATLAKTADGFGDAAAEDRARELVRDPQIAEAFGGRARQWVEKTSRAWDEIERRASQLVAKAGDGLSQAQAVERVLREHPELYARYMQPVEREWASEAAALTKADGGPGLNSGEGVAGPSMSGSASASWSTADIGAGSARQVLLDLAEVLEAAQERGEDVEDVLRRELQDPGVRRVVEAAVDALEEDPTTGAAIAKSEDELWDEIVEKSGASPRDPNFSRTVDGFLSTREGQQLYAAYERAYEARAAVPA